MILILDYGMGNLRSVQMKIQMLNFQASISRDINSILAADKLILPGVGHFAEGMKNIKEFGILDALHEAVIYKKIPILGICLGMQLLTSFSEEGSVSGLGWIDASTNKIISKSTEDLRIPHVGWNKVSQVNKSILFDNIENDTRFYFTHTYAVQCHNKEDSIGETLYGDKFTSVIQKDNIYGTQFHPEKSHMTGLKLIQNFLEKS
ncbi:MAG: imidazole glycerol phosphate synthase subunit HisH [Leptospira sp.]|nr:imidazole glycerol phosphate synthase subunit HisH [Leptospira sp.]